MDLDFSFISGQLDRAGHLRPDPAISREPRALAYVFWQGKLLARDNQPVLIALDHPALGDTREAAIFLGLTPDGPRFGADLALWQPGEVSATIGQFVDPSQQVHPAVPDAQFVEVRGVMAGLTMLDAECVAVGRALLGWTSTHRFCSNCGAPTNAVLSGWERKCPVCGTSHFPRTDPVVIMVIARGDKLLLGRGPSWPERMYSLLAGFVEPGETIESAVRRETFEESGIRVGRVSYVASQPWPFPMSLMFGCIGEALDEALTVDTKELADARWFTRAEVQQIVAGQHPAINAPRHGAIAGALIAAWAAGKL